MCPVSRQAGSTLRQRVASLEAYRDGEVPAGGRGHIVAFATARLCPNEQSEAQHDGSKLQRHFELHAVAAAAGFGKLDSLCFAAVGIWLRP